MANWLETCAVCDYAPEFKPLAKAGFQGWMWVLDYLKASVPELASEKYGALNFFSSGFMRVLTRWPGLPWWSCFERSTEHWSDCSFDDLWRLDHIAALRAPLFCYQVHQLWGLLSWVCIHTSLNTLPEPYLLLQLMWSIQKWFYPVTTDPDPDRPWFNFGPDVFTAVVLGLGSVVVQSRFKLLNWFKLLGWKRIILVSVEQ